MNKKNVGLFSFIALLFLVAESRALDGITQVQTNHASTNIATGAWTQIVGTLSRKVTSIDVYNSSTSGTLILGVGSSGNESDVLYIPPSTARVIPLSIGKTARVSLKAKNATVNAGESIINFLGE